MIKNFAGGCDRRFVFRVVAMEGGRSLQLAEWARLHRGSDYSQLHEMWSFAEREARKSESSIKLRTWKRRMSVRTAGRIALVAFYGVAGVFQLRATDALVAIVPDWVPLPHAVVIFTGLCEILGAAALLTRRLRKPAGVMLALYA